METRYLYKAKRIHDGKWVEGHYYKMSETTYAFAEDYERNPVPVHHYILFEQMTDWGLPNRMMQVEVDPATICQYTGKHDMSGKAVWEGDVIENPDGVRMEIRYGLYDAYCPVDRCCMDSVGFYAVGEGLPEMPIGCLEDYAMVVGNVWEDPTLKIN